MNNRSIQCKVYSVGPSVGRSKSSDLLVKTNDFKDGNVPLIELPSELLPQLISKTKNENDLNHICIKIKKVFEYLIPLILIVDLLSKYLWIPYFSKVHDIFV